MEDFTDDCFKLIADWTIDNFSCWNGDFHEPAMITDGSSEPTIELYPRGLSGREEHMVVRLKGDDPKLSELKGDACFIASNGSLLCRREFDGNEIRDGVLELPPGPKFREVVNCLVLSDLFDKDQLTLRFRFRPSEGETDKLGGATHHIKSVVETFEATVRIRMEQLREIEELEDDTKGFFLMGYPEIGNRMETIGLTVKYSEKADDSIQIGLDVRNVKNKFAVRTRWSLLKSDGSVLRRERNEHVFQDDEDNWVLSDSLTKEEVSQKGYSVVIDFIIIPRNGHKVLSTQLWVPAKAFEVIPAKNFHQTDDVLKTDLMCLYQDQNFSDLTLKCDNVTFPVHKNILSARSPVFKTMLSTDMAASSEVDIGDLDPSTLSSFLTYLYTGAVEEELQRDRVIKLYYAADKYQVPSLKRDCSKFLCSINVSISNVCDILSLADRHRDDQLMSVAHDFILKKFSEVLASEQWGSFMRSEPLLAVETLTQLSKNKKVINEK